MPTYMIELPHTLEECQQTMERVNEDFTELAREAVWGCKAGEHRMWARIEADSADAAREMLPPYLRGQARVTEVQPGDERMRQAG